MDDQGRECGIKGIREVEKIGTWVEFNENSQQVVMFDWNNVRGDVFVKDGTYKE